MTFANDPLAPQLEAFAAAIGSTSYWTATTSEYGVGPGAAHAPIHVTDSPAATLDDGAIQTWLQAQFAAASTGWDAPDPGTIYTLYYPSTTTVTQRGLTSCQGFVGYHSFVVVGGVNIPYAVVPTCSGAPSSSFATIDNLTGVSSHEWVEGATDPFNPAAPAFATPDSNDLGWVLLEGAEIADMCVWNPDAFFILPELHQGVQRTWSDAAARGSHDPCVPSATAGPYFNAAPELGDEVTFSFGGDRFATKGVKIPVGGTKTIDVDLFSDRAAPTWKLDAWDSASFRGLAPQLKVSLDRKTGNNGDKAKLTITVLAQDPGWDAEAFWVGSYTGGGIGTTIHYWVGVVGN